MNSPTLRIAFGTFLTECNNLGGTPTDLARFELYEYLKGEATMKAASGAARGFLTVFAERGARPVPLLAASTCPGGPLTSECWSTIRDGTLDALRAAIAEGGPVDGVALSLHGSGTVEDVDDPEGELLELVRRLVGTAPIVATLDPHGNVTARMVAHADALLGWHTYPHVDTTQSGERAARLLFEVLDGTARPTMALAKVPVIVSGVCGQTDVGPFADVMNRALAMEARPVVLSTSVFLVHPYLDLPGMGGGGLVITHDDQNLANALAVELAELYWTKRFELEPPTFSPEQAISLGLDAVGGPVLLVECADCSGGGAAGDSVATLRVLLTDAPQAVSYSYVVDAAAALACLEAGEGGTVSLLVGHSLDPKFGAPLPVSGTVETCLQTGDFVYDGGAWDGIAASLGPSAVLRIAGTKARVLITTNATYDWKDEQFRAAGLDPSDAKFLVVKSPMNYRIGYPQAKATYVLDTPGATPATLRSANHRRIARPYFPLDEEIAGLAPVVSVGR